MRIRTKFLLIFLALSLVPLTVIGVIAYKNGEEAIKESLGVSFQQIAHEAIDKVDRGLCGVYQNVQTWAGLEVMQEVLTGDVDGRISTFLMGLSKEYGYFSSLSALNREGEAIASSHPELVGRNFQQEAFFKDAVGGTAYVEDTHLDGVSKAWVVTFAFPIQATFEEDKVIGVLVAKWKADELFSMTQLRTTDEEPYQARLLLLRNDGLLLAAPEGAKDDIFKRNVLATGLRSAWLASQKKAGYLIERNEDHARSLIGYDYSKGYRDFPGFGWVALVVQDVRTALAPIARLKIMILGVGAAVAFCVMILSLLVTQRITTPILKIAQIAHKVAQGNLDDRVDHVSGDEIGTLANIVNQMIQDLKRQRAQLVDKDYVDNIIRTMNDTLLVVDPRGRLQTANHAACRLLGYTEDELIGQPMATIVVDDAFPFKGLGLDEAMERDVLSNVESVYVSKDGRNIPVLCSSSVLREHDGKLQGVVYVAQDITERKQAEEALRTYTAELARSNAELEQFAYVASHDLQEPLRMVASYTQLLARRYKGKLDADADEFIAYAVDGANRMQRLINDLLEYSRVSTKGKEFEPTNCAVVLDRALANLQVALEESRAVVTHETLPTVMGDASQVGRLFQNLIGNAIKFHGEHPPRVHVSAEHKGSDWVFSVRDHGIGIDPKFADRVFVLFQRLYTEQEYPGTGIGLAICKKIVERHGGRIWIESQLGNGATFYFTIPAVQAREAERHG